MKQQSFVQQILLIELKFVLESNRAVTKFPDRTECLSTTDNELLGPTSNKKQMNEVKQSVFGTRRLSEQLEALKH